MVRSARRVDGVSIDLIALPLLFCLLAAVVGLFALADNPPPPPCCAPPPDPRPEQLQQLVATAEQLSLEQAVLVRKGSFVVAQRETQDVKDAIGESKEKISLAQKVEAAEANVRSLQERIKAKDSAPPKPSLPPPMPADAGFGTYTGPYVLLECKNDYAIVYPGGWRIASQPSDSDFEKLMSQVRQAGFVAIAIRPDGWLNNSFDKLRPRIFRELGGDAKVGRAVFPIKDSEPIKAYLPI